jgi:hypothetical protein
MRHKTRETTKDLQDGVLAPKRVDSGNLPPTIHDLERPLNEEGAPVVVPTAPERKRRDDSNRRDINQEGEGR